MHYSNLMVVMETLNISARKLNNLSNTKMDWQLSLGYIGFDSQSQRQEIQNNLNNQIL